ncbi:hypothetical protein LUZ60_006749 [Juncus effusus]|nr:hypothetical protein LUZ60_006749 [Juncus effusus]
MEESSEAILFPNFREFYHLFCVEISLFLCVVFNWSFMTLNKFYPKYLTHLIILLFHTSPLCKQTTTHKAKLNRPESEPEPEPVSKPEPELEIEISNTEIRIHKEEIEHIMDKMRLDPNRHGEMKDYIGEREFLTIFEDSEPGLDEIKEAFFIFDQNKDGFIDAHDLQNVLLNLGFRDNTNLDACRYMIRQHDRNHDGKMDLSDFSKLLEMSLF